MIRSRRTEWLEYFAYMRKQKNKARPQRRAQQTDPVSSLNGRIILKLSFEI
jgi:hypothetical protein